MLTVNLLMESCRRFRQFLLMGAQLHPLLSTNCPCLQLELLEAWRRSCVLLLDTELLFLALLEMRLKCLPLVLVLLELVRRALQQLELMRSLLMLGIRGPRKSVAWLS